MPSAADRQRLRLLPLDALRAHQFQQLNALFTTVLPANTFYANKLGTELQLKSLDELSELPLTTKEELLTGVNYPANLTFAPEAYVRFHRTSGTRGRALHVLDTHDDWQWWIESWQFVLDAAGIEPTDRGMLAFSFGPFIGFWTAHEALVARGAMSIPGGGLSTSARLQLMKSTQATALFCTPTYALRLVEVAREEAFDLAELRLRAIVVAGEPGGSLPAVRTRIEQAYGATVYDHAGASEVGPWGFADAARSGVHVLESEFIAEFMHPGTDQPAADGELAELVLTSLGRTGAPVIRYRTGDLVRPVRPTDGPCHFVLLEGGVLGRADDMMIIRGVNIFPSSIEEVLRSFPEVQEYRITAERVSEMDALHVEVEDDLGAPDRIARALRAQLGLQVDVNAVPHGSLPRFEAKGQRFIDTRTHA